VTRTAERTHPNRASGKDSREKDTPQQKQWLGQLRVGNIPTETVATIAERRTQPNKDSGFSLLSRGQLGKRTPVTEKRQWRHSKAMDTFWGTETVPKTAERKKTVSLIISGRTAEKRTQ
jgi:hypothetical protein